MKNENMVVVKFKLPRQYIELAAGVRSHSFGKQDMSGTFSID